MLDLADGMLFRSRFSRKMLTPDAFNDTVFSVDDAAQFYTWQESCREAALSDEQSAELLLNALVAYRFLKPLMPKSWYFRVRQRHYWQPGDSDLVTVTLDESGEEARLLVIEAGESAALCVLAQPQLQLAGKTMMLGDAIKIMHDRLHPWHAEQAQHYAWAG
ncbi:Cell division protein ZapC [Mixta theicola]|nr:Cell division protein ZapC [Mixta theicola]